MAKKKLTAEQENEIKLLMASNDMLVKSKEEAVLRGRTDAVNRIEIARKDILEQIKKIDSSLANELLNDNKEEEQTLFNNDSYHEESIFDVLERSGMMESSSKDNIPIEDNNSLLNDYFTSQEPTQTRDFGVINTDVQYDIVSLPSKGQCYKSKQDRVSVGYLTAYDENLITSPNLYKDGAIIDFLLKHKILDKNINVSELCSGDADAITLFLRATSYGPEFPIIVKDPVTSQDIETTIDLTTLQVKEFNLVGDENGHFEFVLPVSKDVVKFKFLTRKDEKMLQTLSDLEDDGVMAQTIRYQVKYFSDAIKKDKTLNGSEKQELIKKLNDMIPWAQKLESKSAKPFYNTITNRLEMSIVSINGNYDRKDISKYIKNMVAKDSLMLRRYILENEPGINFEIEVQRPESLGGGSFKTFLDWDDSIFLNIA